MLSCYSYENISYHVWECSCDICSFAVISASVLKRQTGIQSVCAMFTCNECDFSVRIAAAWAITWRLLDLAFHITVLCVGCSVVECMIKGFTGGCTHTLGSASEHVESTNDQEEIEHHNHYDRIALYFVFNTQGCNFQVPVPTIGKGLFNLCCQLEIIEKSWAYRRFTG